jgi:hypothetical protein
VTRVVRVVCNRSTSERRHKAPFVFSAPAGHRVEVRIASLPRLTGDRNFAMKRTVDTIQRLEWIGHDHRAADGERHRPEGAERRKPHDEAERQLRYYTEQPQAAVAS